MTSRRKCRYLTGKQPLLLDVDLAVIIGDREALFLNQLDYWLTNNEAAGRNFRDGHYWTYNTYKDWQLQFPFWPAKTIERIVLSLERQNILIVGNYNKLRIDRTKWYRIDYEVVDALEKPACNLSVVISGNGDDKQGCPIPPFDAIVRNIDFPAGLSEKQAELLNQLVYSLAAKRAAEPTYQEKMDRIQDIG